MSIKLTIIIPIYNETENINRVEEECLKFFQISKVSSSVLFINDGSTDDSQSKIEAICSRHKNFNFIEFDKNYGLSTALKAGFDYVDTELVGYMDADLQTHPEDFNLLLDYTEDYILVTGHRHNRNDSFIKKKVSKIANFIRRIFTKDGIQDTGCPLKIIHTDNAKQIPMFRGLHRFLPAMIQLQNGNVKEVPVRHFPRINGSSKFGIKNRIFSPLLDCFAYLWIKKRIINYSIKNKSIRT